MKILFCMLLIAHASFSEEINKKINLEDIERDNLINERRSQTKEELEGQHTQHLRPSSIHASTNYQIQHDTDDVSANDITYAHQDQTQNQQYEIHQQNSVQYVTIEPEQYQEEKEYESQSQSLPSSQYRPVHEEGRTYSAPSRHSLESPIIPKPSATPSPYLTHQQPQYVYVQAGQQPTHQTQQSNTKYSHQSQEGVRYAQGTSYTQQQSDDGNYVQGHQAEPEQAEHADITYVHQTQEGVAYSPQPQQYIQYVPYVSQGPDQQTFIMMVPLRNAQSYVHSRPSLPYTHQSTYLHHSSEVSPTKAYTNSVPAEENAVLHAPHSTISPAISSHLQYSAPSYPSYHSSQSVHPSQSTHPLQSTHLSQSTHQSQSPHPSQSIQYTPQQVQIQQSVEYPSRHEYYHSPKVISLHTSLPHSLPQSFPHSVSQSIPQSISHSLSHSIPQTLSHSIPQTFSHSIPQSLSHSLPQSHFQPSYQYGSPQLDYFGAYNKQHSSLLDSYIPSSVILERQRSFLQKNQVYQPSSTSSVTNHISTANGHSLNGYNTIAYSTPLGYSYNHLKRSPSQPASTKLIPKATKLSKV